MFGAVPQAFGLTVANICLVLKQSGISCVCMRVSHGILLSAQTSLCFCLFPPNRWKFLPEIKMFISLISFHIDQPWPWRDALRRGPIAWKFSSLMGGFLEPCNLQGSMESMKNYCKENFLSRLYLCQPLISAPPSHSKVREVSFDNHLTTTVGFTSKIHETVKSGQLNQVIRWFWWYALKVQ